MAISAIKINIRKTFFCQKKLLCNENYRQNTIFEQNLKTFGECQNCQNLTFKWPYQLYKSK